MSKEIVIEMSGGHKLRLTVSKFGEMCRIIEEQARKETANKIYNFVEKFLKYDEEDLKTELKQYIKELLGEE